MRSMAFANVRYHLGVAEKEPAKAARWLGIAASNNHAKAHLLLSESFRDGVGVAVSIPAAMLALKKAAQLGNVEAQFKLGEVYVKGSVKGLGLERDEVEACRWFKAAALKHFYPAEAALGKLLEKFAEGGDVGAQYELALLYSVGAGVPKDDAKCARWMETAATLGHTTAMFKLAAMYDMGLGLSKSGEESVKWCREAAERGHPHAQCRLGECFRIGHGVSQDLRMAGRWLLKAAVAGIRDAQFSVALMYKSGKGLVKDPDRAVIFMSLAADAGHEEAPRRLQHWKASKK